MTRAIRKGDQALPKRGQVDVGPEVIKDVLKLKEFRSASAAASIAADFESRIQLGIERYGHPLQTHNGRDALKDAYDELLDAAHYLKQITLEEAHGKAMLAYWSVLGLIFDLQESMAR